MTDTPNQIKNKINRHGFSGGQETEEEHRKLGGNPDVDVSYQYLTFMLDDDGELAKIYNVGPDVSADFSSLLTSPPQDYKAGVLLTGQLKARCIQVLQELVKGFQEVSASTCTDIVTSSIVLQRRSKVTDAEVAKFMDASRKIDPTLSKSCQPPAAAE